MLRFSDERIGLLALIAFAIWLFAVLPFLVPFLTESNYPPYPPQILSEQRPSEGVSQQHQTDPIIPGKITPHSEQPSSNTTNHTQEVTIFGVRVGEGLLAIATLLLVAATWYLVLDARHNAERQLRAYMSVEHEGIIESIEKDKIVARVGFLNNGAVFAKNAATFMTWKTSRSNELKEPDLPINEAKVIGNNDIAPRATLRRSIDYPDAMLKTQIEAERSAAQADGQPLYLYVWGIIRYGDGFSKERRFTKFCHRYNFSGVPAGTYDVPESNYRYHHYGNKAG
jgi:hypothetical protein